MKDKQKGKEPSIFRPITYLPLMWKLLTGAMCGNVYKHLNENNLLPEEQKGFCMRSGGTRDQLPIDKTLIKNCKIMKAVLNMVLIDHRKKLVCCITLGLLSS